MIPEKEETPSRSFQVYMGLSFGDIQHFLDAQVGVADYLQPGIEGEPSPDHSYSQNETLWADLLADKLGPTTVVTLQDIYLLEWFPRSPGLYHTPGGAESRGEALHHVIRAPSEAPSSVRAEIHPGVRDLLRHANDAEYVFDPYGKYSMLRGGIGCFRLKGRTLRKIGTIYFLSASSSGVAHEGFLVGLPESLYARYVDQLKTRGGIRCSITGRLQQIPKSVVRLFECYYTGVPELYLLVEDLQLLARGSNIELSATAAISFQSEFEGVSKMYATYATFHPGKKDSLRRAVAWIEEAYVHKLYHGKVITDFDETVRMFEGAPLSLSKILDNKLDMREVSTLLSELHLHGNTSRLQEFLGRVQSNLVHLEREVPPVGKPIVISLHGIRTRGNWQKHLSPALGERVHSRTPGLWFLSSRPACAPFHARQKDEMVS